MDGTVSILLQVGLGSLLLCACAWGDRNPEPTTQPPADRSEERRRMVRTQIEARGVHDQGVLEAMRKVARDRFVPPEYAADAYGDHPLPIGHDQTISQPYIVGLMTELIEPKAGMKVLEIGTGSGYQAAILAELVGEVYTIEIVEPLGRQAADLLERLGYDNVHVRIGDGFAGWPEQAPFDAVLVTAAPRRIPQPLLDQLAVGGKLVIPVGSFSQQLLRVTRTEQGFEREPLIGVRFVPMTGKAQQER